MTANSIAAIRWKYCSFSGGRACGVIRAALPVTFATASSGCARRSQKSTPASRQSSRIAVRSVCSTIVKITTAGLPCIRSSASWRSATVSTRGWRTVTNAWSGNCASTAATTRVAVSPVASETT